jgi:hypothetical protein
MASSFGIVSVRRGTQAILPALLLFLTAAALPGFGSSKGKQASTDKLVELITKVLPQAADRWWNVSVWLFIFFSNSNPSTSAHASFRKITMDFPRSWRWWRT